MTEQDLDAVARTLYGEARGETTLGQLAVAFVIRHRAEMGGWWGATPYAVCHHAYQFSCWNANDPNSAKLAALPASDPTYAKLHQIAHDVMSGAAVDPTRGATHYKVHGTAASWDAAVAGQHPVSIGHHDFFRLAS